MSLRVVIRAGDPLREPVDAFVCPAADGGGLERDAGTILGEGDEAALGELRRALVVPPLGSAAWGEVLGLGARSVIFAGIRGKDAETVDAETLRAAVRRSFELAAEHGCRSVAFPAIGVHPGGLSARRCAEILLEEARRRRDVPSSLEEVRLVVLEEPILRVFEAVDDALRIAEQATRLGVR